MQNKNQAQARLSGQSAAGSAQKSTTPVVKISGSRAVVRRLKKAYQLREVLLPLQKEEFDRFVASRGGKFAKTEEQILELLCEDTPKCLRHTEALKMVTDHFEIVGGWPKGSKSIWAKWHKFLRHQHSRLWTRAAERAWRRWCGPRGRHPRVSV